MAHWTLNYLLCLGIAILLTSVIIPKILLIAFRRKLFDTPDERKVHTGVVPRLGGIAFLPALMFSFCIVMGFDMKYSFAEVVVTLKEIAIPVVFFLCGITLIYLIGLADDLVGVKYRSKFAVQIIAGVLVTMSGMYVTNLHGLLEIHEWAKVIGWIFTIVGIIYVVNAVNLIDGIDGLASGLSSVALIWFSYMFWESGMYGYMMLAAATLGTLIPFFYFNVFGSASKHTKIFMGDTGSLTIGMILAFMVIVAFNVPEQKIEGGYNVTVMALSPIMVPCFDVARVFFHRVRRGRSPFLPDKTHIHHKLLALGFRQSQALILIVMADMLLVVANMLLSNVVQCTFVILGDVVILILINWYITKRIRKIERVRDVKLYD